MFGTMDFWAEQHQYICSVPSIVTYDLQANVVNIIIRKRDGRVGFECRYYCHETDSWPDAVNLDGRDYPCDRRCDCGMSNNYNLLLSYATFCNRARHRRRRVKTINQFSRRTRSRLHTLLLLLLLLLIY